MEKRKEQKMAILFPPNGKQKRQTSICLLSMEMHICINIIGGHPTR